MAAQINETIEAAAGSELRRRGVADNGSRIPRRSPPRIRG